MTRTDNNDGTWDILFDNDSEVLLDYDLEFICSNTVADDVWCPVKKETKYEISINVPTGKTLSNGKKVVNTVLIESSQKPYIVGNFFCYTSNFKNVIKTALIPYHEISAIEIVCEEREILRIADSKNPLLFHYKYGEPIYRTVTM